jgi:hypothetical protein
VSLSSEWFYYHLTPRGWVEGTERLDFGAGVERPAPDDRVLTVVFHEYLSSIYSPPGREAYVQWQHPDALLAKEYEIRFGPPPHWQVDQVSIRPLTDPSGRFEALRKRLAGSGSEKQAKP